MQYRSIPHCHNLQVSVVGIGTWPAGGTNWGTVNDKETEAAILRSLDLGVNLIDTAPIYGKGHAEEMVGRAIRGRRKSVVISTKCGLPIRPGQSGRCLRPESVITEVEDSLRRLETDVIDILFCHWPDKETPIEDTVGALCRLREQGKIRAFGLSNHPIELVERAVAVGPVSCLQEHYSLVNRTIEQSLVPYALKHGLVLFAYGPLGGGILTGKYHSTPPSFEERDVRNFFYPFYKEPLWSRTQELLGVLREVAQRHKATPAQTAIAWVAAQPGVATVLAGAKNASQASDNATAAAVRLSEDDIRILTSASDRVVIP